MSIKSKSLQSSQPSTSPQMLLISSSTASLSSLCKNVLCLIIGFTIGIYSTGMWLNDKSQCSTLAINPITTTTKTALVRNNTTDSTVTPPGHATPAPASGEGSAATDIVEYLHNTTRVLCWIMTNPDNHLTKAIHIRHTWGRRCNKLLFMSSQEDEELQSIALPVEEGRDHLWNKTQLALKYIYDHHLDDADWFLKADDDTYVIMENLRSFLYQYPAELPIYFGCKLDQLVRQGYMSGGAGYVLSKSALMKFSTEAYNNNRVCDPIYTAEDLQLGMCLENIGVIAGDSRDAEGKERFVPLPTEDVIPDHRAMWYSTLVYHKQNENVSCCSPHAISFHYIGPREFYVMEYLLYSLRPFGVFDNSTATLPQKVNVTETYSAKLEYLHPLSKPPTSDGGSN